MNNITKETGRKGFTTYKANNKYIYSYYDPVQEADKFIQSQKIIKKIIITCCGADYVNELLIKKNSIDLILSFEPFKFEQTVNSAKIIRIKTINEIEKILLEKNIHSKDISLLIWQPLVESNPEIYLKELNKLKEILLKTSVSANTAKSFGFMETKNFLMNLNAIEAINILTKADAFIPNPSCIISSGPSLTDQVDYIKKIQNFTYLFALPSSLAFLQHHEINPDFVIAVDPGYGTYYHLTKYQYKTNLITTFNVTSSIFNLKNYNYCFFNYGNYFENILYKDSNAVTSYSEGNVFINLLRLLPQLGFKEVIIFGQDFGYKNNRSHINEGNFEKEFLYLSDYFNSLENNVKKTDCKSDKTFIEIKNKKIPSIIPLKIYFEHFINEKFDIKIFLPFNCYNELSNDFQKKPCGYFIDKYSQKYKPENILKIKRLDDIIEKKKNIFNCFKKNHDNYSNEIYSALFIDKENQLHINKIDKILKELN